MEQVQMTDYHPPHSDLLQEVQDGFSQQQKMLSPKWFYDETGSRLFDEITRLPEYYPTRTELGILEQNANEMAKVIGPNPAMIEFGSGSSHKVRLLLNHLQHPVAYVPVDISRDFLLQSANELAKDYPELTVHAVCADFTQTFTPPAVATNAARTLVFFPGSTIGNFDPAMASHLLGVMRETIAGQGGVLIGVDLKKSREMLEQAYNDTQGVTARFNLNLLARLNRELNTNFDLCQFRHNAIYNAEDGRIEMHLVSEAHQAVLIGEQHYDFAKGEYILTEYSYKYDIEQFALMAEEQGFRVKALWTDESRLFGVYYLVPVTVA